MEKSTTGKFLIGSIVIAIVGAFAENSGFQGAADFMYQIGGLGTVIFGLWGGWILSKMNN